MKKYRLIREYPGSPKLGTTEEVEDCFKNLMMGSNGKYLYNISESPEFWEEVIEKDYEILSLARFCSIKPTITDVSDYNDEFIEAMLKCDKARIHSIKRKSDGEVFTIGDRIQYYNITGEKSHTHAISDITIYENKILLNHNHGTWKSHGDFNKVQKIKQPLFTTEDGVDIFEGDTIFGVNTDWKVFSHYTDLQNKVKSWGIKPIFSIKEKAEEYILYNKPCLSLKEIKETTTIKGLSLKKLEKLVQQKLNNNN